MKKFLVFFSFLLGLVLSNCAQSTPRVTYQNKHYQFALEFPETYSYCLNDFCFNEIPDDAIATFYLKDEIGRTAVIIQPYLNFFSGTIVEFAKNSLGRNRTESELSSQIYSEEKETVFAGEEAFTFLASGGFEERGSGLTTDENGYIALMEVPEASPFSLNISETFHVVYVDHGPYFYRILYRATEEIEEIMEGFRFLD